MNILKKILFPLLMIALLVGAFVLPKFVQRSNSPSDAESPASGEAEALASEVELDPIKILEEIEEEMPVEAAPATMRTSPLNSPEVLAFFGATQAGEFDRAATILGGLKETVDAETIATLELNLSAAQERASMLAASQSEISALRSENQKIQKSVKELSKASKNAESLATQAKELRKELDAIKKEGVKAAAAPEVVARLPKESIPEKVIIAFGKDSSVLTDEHKSTLATAVEAMDAEERLTLQLRGYADASGSSQYNAMIALARSETVKDFFLDAEITEDRLSVISFGESQAAQETEGPPRRVELRFGQR